MSPGRRGGPALKHETATDEVPATVATILALTSGAGQTPARTREQVETLVMRVRATGMHLSTQASRDDGWPAAHARFDAAVGELAAVALGLVAVVEQGVAVDVEPRARGLQRHTESRTTRSSCRTCGRTFSSSGTAASHAAASRHVVDVEYRTAFRFEPAEASS